MQAIMLLPHRPLGKALFYSIVFHGGLLLTLLLAHPDSIETRVRSVSAAPALLTLAILSGHSASPPNTSVPVRVPENTAPGFVPPAASGNPPDTAPSPAQESSGYYSSNDLDTLPRVVQDIPEETGLQLPPDVAGTAIIRLYINEAGTVDDVMVEETDFAVTDMRALMLAFHGMRFLPGTIGQTAVKNELRIEIRVKPPALKLPARAKGKWQ